VGPGVQSTISFLWIQGAPSDLDKLIPPLQLGLCTLDQFIDISQEGAGQHCHIIKEYFDTFGDCKGKSQVLNNTWLDLSMVCINEGA